MIYQRLIQSELAGKKSDNKVRLIFGARQTGKTVLVNQLLRTSDSQFYNLQDASVRLSFERDPNSFTREIRGLSDNIRNIVVDEIQKVPSLLDEIQYLYDSDPSRHQFYLTGSSARSLKRHSANLLPGRCHLYNLYPVIRPEEKSYQGIVGDFTRQSSSPFPNRTLEDRLLHGNLPGIRQEPSESAIATLDAYVKIYLEEEIRREGLARNLGAFQVFLQLAAIESGKQINLSKLSQDSGIAVSTIKTYYQLLADTFVGYWMHSHKGSGRKRLLTTPRFYFFDLGVRNAAAQITATPGILPEIGGNLVEHWAGLELIQRARYAGRGYNAGFWRTVSGAEVDFIWQTPDEDIPIEVKWTENPNPHDARHLETFLNHHPQRSKKGYVMCRVPRRQKLTKRTIAIPWFEL